uniref:Troponin T n=1 Tax=Arion vulgaris TaxID=1028688 RepID=A0A0B6ZKU4_9EUPU
MSDDEHPVEAAQVEEHHEEKSHDHFEFPLDSNEAKLAMEEAKRARLEKQAADLAEYEETRKLEREKEEEEIRSLKEKRIQRQKERVEEEKRLVHVRAQEEVKRKAEEEERRRKKAEEEVRVKDERDRKKKEAEERLKPKGRNFKISKKSESEKEKPGNQLDAIMTKEELQKSKEQLEEEKQAILAQRIQPLITEGLSSEKLAEKARDLNDHIRRLEGDKYDLEQRFKRQQYDMIELAERSRQMNKGKAKRGVATVQVDESFDRLADKFTSAPPKIQLCSKYERHTDHRSYKERMVLFEELAKDPPPPEINRLGTPQKGQDEGAAETAQESAE